LIVNEISESARKKLLPSFVDSFEVVAAELGDDSTAMGAAAWVRELAAEPVEAKA
jgi:glucokinase